MSQKPFISRWREVGLGVAGPSSVCEKRGADETDGPLAKIPRLFTKPFIPELVSYGTFYIIGYNGFIPPCNRGRVRSYCKFMQRDYANGVKFSRVYQANSHDAMKAAMATGFHSIVYKFSVNKSVVVEYRKDETRDMFQIGRSAEAPIDFVVMDLDTNQRKGNCSVSRYACRVLVDRKNFKDIRAYAAGFDESLNIFLGEKAIKWQEGNVVDALTTNGTLIYHPKGDYWGGDAKPGVWHELSVCGKLFTLRFARDSLTRGVLTNGETNLLKDGSLIDVCGATLLWRSAEGLKKSMTKKKLHDSFKSLVETQEAKESKILVPQVNKHMEKTLVPRVHLNCGHLRSDWDPESTPQFARCPICSEFGPTAELCVGIEPAFYVDDGPLLYAFNPCGHIANKKTVMYWAGVNLPTKYSFEPKCPFCATVLARPVGYVRLKNID